MQLFFERPCAVRELLLVRPERAQLPLLGEHALRSFRPHRPRQLVLEVARAGEEPCALEFVTVGASERAQEIPLLAEVIQPGKPDVAVPPEEAREVPVAAHRHDGDAFGFKIAATAARQRLDGVRSLVPSTSSTPRGSMVSDRRSRISACSFSGG